MNRENDMALPPTRMLELFSGGAGLGLGVALAIPSIRTVCHVEREAYAAAVLVARMADAVLDQAPIWDDVITFNGGPWRGVVDLITGGFPCQDISVAGKGAGLAGKRSGLWSEFARIISEVRPRFVFIENVAALRSRGLDQVLSDLATLGFDAEWSCIRASDVGATHRRDRIFILAESESERREQRDGREFEARGRPESCDGVAPMVVVGNPDLSGLEGWGMCPSERSGQRFAWTSDLPCEWPPSPLDSVMWEHVITYRPDLEPTVRRVAHGMANRVERLRLLGNGVVPLQAAHAFRVLWNRLHM